MLFFASKKIAKDISLWFVIFVFLKGVLLNLLVIHFASWEVKLKAGQRYTLRGELSSCQRESRPTNNSQVDSSSCL